MKSANVMANDMDFHNGKDEWKTPTLEFKMSTDKWIREMIFRYAWIWMLALSLLGVAGIAFGIVIDLRWLVCALMLICIVLPMTLIFFYYYFGLRREAFVNTIPHSIRLSDDGLFMKLRLSSTLSVIDDNASVSNLEDDDSSNSFERSEFFAYSDMLPVQFGASSAVIPLKSPAKGFIWIPSAAFYNDSHLKRFLETLDKNVQSASYNITGI